MEKQTEEGYNKALSLLHDCVTPDGFVASPSDHDNYRRVWSRDGTIISLAAILTGGSDTHRGQQSHRDSAEDLRDIGSVSGSA